MSLRTELVSGVIPPLAGRLPQVSSLPSVSVWRAFELLSVRLGLGQTAESIRVRTFAKHGFLYAVAYAAASPVLFPAEVIDITTREIQEIQQENRGELGSG